MSIYKATFVIVVDGLFSVTKRTFMELYEAKDAIEAKAKAEVDLKDSISRNGLENEYGLSSCVTDIVKVE